MLTLVYTAAMGLSIGVAAVVARRIGERPDAAAEAAVQGIALGLGVAAVAACLGITLAPRLLAVMGASPAVTAIGSGYTRMMLGGSATVLLLFLINAIFRGAGDAAEDRVDEEQQQHGRTAAEHHPGVTRADRGDGGRRPHDGEEAR